MSSISISELKKNLVTSSEKIQALDDDAWVGQLNENEVMFALMKRADQSLMTQVASSRFITEKMADFLKNCPYLETRVALYTNPVAKLDELNPKVISDLIQNLLSEREIVNFYFLNAVLIFSDYKTRIQLSKRKNLTASTERFLFQLKDPLILVNLYCNPNVSKEIKEVLHEELCRFFASWLIGEFVEGLGWDAYKIEYSNVKDLSNDLLACVTENTSLHSILTMIQNETNPNVEFSNEYLESEIFKLLDRDLRIETNILALFAVLFEYYACDGDVIPIFEKIAKKCQGDENSLSRLYGFAFQMLEGYSEQLEEDLFPILNQIIECLKISECSQAVLDDFYSFSEFYFNRNISIINELVNQIARQKNVSLKVLSQISKFVINLIDFEEIEDCRDYFEKARVSVVENPSTPLKLLEEMVFDASPSVRAAIARKENVSKDLLWKLSHDPSEVVRKLVASNKHSDVKTLVKLSNDSQIIVSMLACLNGMEIPLVANNFLKCFAEFLSLETDIEESFLIVLSKCSSNLLKYNIAINPSSTINVLRVLSKDSEITTLKKICQHPNCDDLLRAEIIVEKLKSFNPCETHFYSESGFDKGSVASDPRAPASVLEALSKDSYWKVRKIVAENLNCDETILSFLARDSDYDVVKSVASNPNTGINDLRALANSEKVGIRLEVANNTSTPKELLELLSKDHDEAVSSEAKEKLKFSF